MTLKFIYNSLFLFLLSPSAYAEDDCKYLNGKLGFGLSTYEKKIGIEPMKLNQKTRLGFNGLIYPDSSTFTLVDHSETSLIGRDRKLRIDYSAVLVTSDHEGDLFESFMDVIQSDSKDCTTLNNQMKLYVSNSLFLPISINDTSQVYYFAKPKLLVFTKYIDVIDVYSIEILDKQDSKNVHLITIEIDDKESFLRVLDGLYDLEKITKK
ncbi:MAG: hypothetical protein ACSHW0_19170 [Thalassotalea sp.]